MVLDLGLDLMLSYLARLWTSLCNVLVGDPDALPVGFIDWIMLFWLQADLVYHWFAGLCKGFIVLSLSWPI